MSQQAVEGFGRLQGILLDNCFSDFSNVLLVFPLNLLMEFYTPKPFNNGILQTETILRIFSTSAAV